MTRKIGTPSGSADGWPITGLHFSNESHVEHVLPLILEVLDDLGEKSYETATEEHLRPLPESLIHIGLKFLLPP